MARLMNEGLSVCDFEIVLGGQAVVLLIVAFNRQGSASDSPTFPSVGGLAGLITRQGVRGNCPEPLVSSQRSDRCSTGLRLADALLSLLTGTLIGKGGIRN